MAFVRSILFKEMTKQLLQSIVNYDVTLNLKEMKLLKFAESVLALLSIKAVSSMKRSELKKFSIVTSL